MAKPSTIHPSQVSRRFWCYACRKEHDGMSAGLIGEKLHLCQPGLHQYESLGVLERERDGEPPVYRLAAHQMKRR